MFESFARADGREAEVFSVTKGGRSLRQYLEADEITQKLDAACEREYDVCFIQEQSVLPITDFDSFLTGVRCVMGKVRAKRYILYVTWGRKEGCDKLTELGLTNATMTQKLHDAYKRAAEICGTELSDVGAAFAGVKDTELYDPDMSHPSYEGSRLAAITHYRTCFGEMPGELDSGSPA